MQIKPQSRRQLAPGTLVLDYGQTAIGNAALQSQCDAQQVLGVDCCAVNSGAVSIGLGHFAPGGNDLPEAFLISLVQWQRLVDVMSCQFFLDETEGFP